jgi:DNA polymerase III epsilon subunit-like protein
MNTTVIFFDTETNGLQAQDSVLSISALKCVFQCVFQRAFHGTEPSAIVEQYERFYYRRQGEPFGAGAVGVNGLTDEVITEKRGAAAYPLYFHEDIAAFRAFCGTACHFAAHNIAFDKQFIPFPLPYMFCTMKENKKAIQLRRRTGALKYPSLRETARFYGIETDTSRLHGSSYDAGLVYAIFQKMLAADITRKKIRAFLNKKPPGTAAADGPALPL